MSALDNLRVIEAFLVNHDPKYFAVDAVYQDLSTGQLLRGRPAIAQTLDEFYRTGFSHVDAEVRNIIANDRSVAVEVLFHGLHSGKWRGHAATNKNVDFPFCIVYDVEGDVIRRARSYADWRNLERQLGVES